MNKCYINIYDNEEYLHQNTPFKDKIPNNKKKQINNRWHFLCKNTDIKNKYKCTQHDTFNSAIEEYNKNSDINYKLLSTPINQSITNNDEPTYYFDKTTVFFYN